MNLTWHIVKKDLRRLWLPLTLWGLTVAVGTGADAFRLSPDLRLTHLGAMSLVAGVFATAVGWGLAVVLAALLVQSDPLKNTSAFWMTRPISGRRLLAAKAWTLALLMFLPVVAQLAIQAAYGARATELLLAAAEAGIWRAVVILGAAAVATVTEDLGNFVVRALALILAGGFIAIFATSMIRASNFMNPAARPAETLTLSAVLAAKLIALGLAAGFAAWRYLSRHVRLAPVCLYLSALAVMVTPALWSWDFLQPRRVTPFPSAEVPVFTLRTPELQVNRSGTALSTVSGWIAPVWCPTGEIAVPQGVRGVALQGSDGQNRKTNRIAISTRFRGNERTSAAAYAPAALQRCLTPLRLLNPPSQVALNLDLAYLNSDEVSRIGQERLQLRARVDAVRCRFEVEAEAPATPGGGARIGRAEFRVEKATSAGGKVFFTLREQEYRSSLLGENSGVEMSYNPLLVDRMLTFRSLRQNVFYVLANRVRGEALLPDQPPAAGRTSLGEFSVDRRPVQFSSGKSGAKLDAEWQRDAILLRVRLVELGPLECPLSTEGVMLKN